MHFLLVPPPNSSWTLKIKMFDTFIRFHSWNFSLFSFLGTISSISLHIKSFRSIDFHLHKKLNSSSARFSWHNNHCRDRMMWNSSLLLLVKLLLLALRRTIPFKPSRSVLEKPFTFDSNILRHEASRCCSSFEVCGEERKGKEERTSAICDSFNYMPDFH